MNKLCLWKIVFFLLYSVSIISCNKAKNPGLSDAELAKLENVKPAQKQKAGNDGVKIIESAELQPEQSRAINPAAPPKVLNLANRNQKTKDIDLSRFYSKVKLIRLEHPPVNMDSFNEKEQRIAKAIMEDYELRVTTVSDEYILAENDFGLHCFDREGTFLFTVNDRKLPKKIPEKQTSLIIMDSGDTQEGYLGFSDIYKNSCLLITVKNKEYILKIVDLQTRQEITSIHLEQLYRGNLKLLSDQVYMNYYYWAFKACDYFSSVYNKKGEVIGQFANYIPQSKGSGNMIHADDGFFYRFNNQLYIRQSFNDTVYQVISNVRLQPAYILNLGENVVNAVSGTTGKDISKKLIPDTWYESDQFLLFLYTKNYVCPNTLSNRSVEFYYAFMDKSDGQIWHLPVADTQPHELLIKNTIPGGVPIVASQIKTNNGLLWGVYYKSIRDLIMKHKLFSTLPSVQQEKIREMNLLKSNKGLV